MMQHLKYFRFSGFFLVVGMALAYMWGGVQGLVIATLLTVMEISLSFDNAVVNATVLRHMSEVWQKRFLTWGILIAVFGMRLVFPIVIVALATGLGLLEVTHMAFNDSAKYSEHVLAAHVDIASFGGMFLLMVFLQFICDEAKEIHWFRAIERRLSQLGKLESVEVVIAFTVLLVLQNFLPEADRLHAMISGTIGVVLYVLVKSITAMAGGDGDHVTKTAGYSGFMGFMYLQLLDASFSLDGVIGAFAMSSDVVIIMLGLGVGAFFVRSLTVYFVQRGTLDEYRYLEHGAHYGIGALAVIMLLSMQFHVPEVITGLIGVSFILWSLWSSVREHRLEQKNHGNV